MATDVSRARELAHHIAPPEPGLTIDELLQRADAMRPLLRERQAECEQLRELPADTNDRFRAAGFYRMLQPRLFGGYEFALPDFIRVMIAVARGCSDSAWVLALTAGHTVLAAQLSESAQREVFGPTGDFRAPGVGRPGGAGVPVDGRLRVNGAWDYASGCDLATHFFGSTMVRDPATNASLGNAWILFDRDQFKIVDNWNVIGMQGTGSRRVVIENVGTRRSRALVSGWQRPPGTRSAWPRSAPQPHVSWLARAVAHFRGRGSFGGRCSRRSGPLRGNPQK
jgi:3-hydroxy-9,10-secoandrosta-1,3,5(10)-triene-9,17-dione monooxygenase